MYISCITKPWYAANFIKDHDIKSKINLSPLTKMSLLKIILNPANLLEKKQVYPYTISDLK